MTVTTTATSPSAKPVSPLLYPALLIAGICVIIASLLGIAAMSGLLPQARPLPDAMEKPAAAYSADPAAVPGKPAGSSAAPPPEAGAGRRVPIREGRQGPA